MLSKLLISGLQRAAVVFHSTDEVRRQLLSERLVDPAKLVHAPFGIAPEFNPLRSQWDELIVGPPFLLNVGSCIPRKNISFLLEIFAAIRREFPELRLVQIGGAWTPEQLTLLDRLGLTEVCTQLRGISRAELAAYYRQARAVLLPTSAEGFGLPLTEALACSASVLASRLPVLIEVGGDAAQFAGVSQLPEWLAQLRPIVSGSLHADAERCAAQAARYSWAQHARIVVDAYRRLDYRSSAA
jgi:glycosyltransferase involved in cell wall biosynthesis